MIRFCIRPASRSLGRRLLGRLGVWAICCMVGVATHADGPADNEVATIRPIPPPGIEVPADVRTRLTAALAPLREAVTELAASKDPFIQKHLPDAEIFARAVAIALDEDGFFEPADFERAEALVAEGLRRCAAIRSQSRSYLDLDGAPATTVRGFRSRLDGTAQPYGVVFTPGETRSGRADVWCRGRSEKGLELQFLATRMRSPEPLPDAGVVMIHPFGRYCNANKLAGEVDTLEAVEHAIGEYALDPGRIAIRGFSMGGAAAWHLAVHYPDRWFAAAPGAGFSETPEFLEVFQAETLEPFWFEERLWEMHDCPVWIRNLRVLPTIAYSGDLDRQKQAADVMARASWNLPEDERFELAHIVAANTGHSVTPAAKAEIDRRLRLLDPGPGAHGPDRLVFTTTTLRYDRMHWFVVDGLREHHVATTVRADFEREPTSFGDATVTVALDGGVTRFTLDRDADELGTADAFLVRIEDPAAASVPFVVRRRSDRSLRASFRVTGGRWERVSPLEPPATELRKTHLQQGPIDDAFLGPFLFVRPDGPGLHPQLDDWVRAEMEHAIRQWRRQMRGEVRIVSSAELTPVELANHHLILWGDPRSNPTIARVLAADGPSRLPLRWTDQALELGPVQGDPRRQVPLIVYPNPLATGRYVVFNSGFTWREYDALNNARQVPKLPDWVFVDLATPPDGRWPGGIAEAGFFDERWQVNPPQPPTRRRVTRAAQTGR